VIEEASVSAAVTGGTVLQHPLVGLLDCECDAEVSPPSQQRLVLFRGTPGTGTAERLAMLQVIGTQRLEPDRTDS